MKNYLFWVLAAIFTITAVIYQRMTGPTYPLRGKISINDSEIKYKLVRSHGGESDHKVMVNIPDPEISGRVLFKRYKTDDPWSIVLMAREGDALVGYLPHQPPAGKLAYRVILIHTDKEISLSGESPIIIRFKGDVPAAILIPHVLLMFLAMLVSTRTGIEALNPKSNPRKFALWSAALLFVGGLILGPLVQKFAFGSLWTGFPFGHDLTDNKTLIAMLGWLAAIIAGRGGRPARGWVLFAAILLFAVYLIPHSVMGSELDYSKMKTPYPYPFDNTIPDSTAYRL